MLKPVYIRATRAICGQDSFENNKLPATLREPANNQYSYIQPDFSKYFTIMQLRRMSRVTKMGMTAALACLEDAGINKPEAIITGTGKGSVGDTEKFIHSIDEFDEGTLNPTPFIQSTYNSLNGLIGLHHQTNCYNTTYVHRGFALELALTDAMMLLEEDRIKNALVGSFEEMTPELYLIKSKLGRWRKGIIAGEGSFFFVLQDHAQEAMARLAGVDMLFEPESDTLIARMKSFLKQHKLTPEDIDVIMTGYCGAEGNDEWYDLMLQQFREDTIIQAFKPVCGEFDTAAGFGLWAAIITIQQQCLIPGLTTRPGNRSALRNILLYSHFDGRDHVFHLVQHPC
jgi:3-oxoacyl-(acyl-carrier-protein) synthase